MKYWLFWLWVLALPALAQVPIHYLPGSEDGLIHGHLFSVPVKVAGQETRFILDTGIGVTLISADLARRLKVPETGVTFTGQRMSGQSIRLPLSWVPSLEVGEHKQTFATVGVWDFHGFLPATPEFAGIEGFLSLRFLEHTPFTIDYAGGAIVLETPATLAERLARGSAVELRLEDEEGVSLTCFAPLLVGDQTAWVEIDTGSDSLILHTRYAAPNGVDLAKARKVESHDETQHAFVRYFTTMAGPVKLGSARRGDLRVMFQDIIHDGLIGDDFLRHYVVTFDLEHSRLILGLPHERAADGGRKSPTAADIPEGK